MTEDSTKPVRRRRWWKYFLYLVVIGTLTALALLIYVNTDSFQSMVRRRLDSSTMFFTPRSSRICAPMP